MTRGCYICLLCVRAVLGRPLNFVVSFMSILPDDLISCLWKRSYFLFYAGNLT